MIDPFALLRAGLRLILGAVDRANPRAMVEIEEVKR